MVVFQEEFGCGLGIGTVGDGERTELFFERTIGVIRAVGGVGSVGDRSVCLDKKCDHEEKEKHYLQRVLLYKLLYIINKIKFNFIRFCSKFVKSEDYGQKAAFFI